MIGIVGVLFGAAACGKDDVTQDRADPNPDHTDQATNVTVYYNVDNAPNVVGFCIGQYRFISTLSGGDQGDNKTAVLLRFPEQDTLC